MEQPLHIYENLLWNILDDSSKIYILTLLIKNEFEGECKLTSVIKDDITIISIKDEIGKIIELPINILEILND